MPHSQTVLLLAKLIALPRQLFLGDLVIVWRLYVVWGNNIYIAFIPFLMCLGELCECAHRFLRSHLLIMPNHTAVGYGSISQWLAPTQNFTVMSRMGSAQFILSLVVNILVTMIIAGRIW